MMIHTNNVPETMSTPTRVVDSTVRSLTKQLVDSADNDNSIDDLREMDFPLTPEDQTRCFISDEAVKEGYITYGYSGPCLHNIE